MHPRGFNEFVKQLGDRIVKSTFMCVGVLIVLFVCVVLTALLFSKAPEVGMGFAFLACAVACFTCAIVILVASSSIATVKIALASLVTTVGAGFCAIASNIGHSMTSGVMSRRILQALPAWDVVGLIAFSLLLIVFIYALADHILWVGSRGGELGSAKEQGQIEAKALIALMKTPAYANIEPSPLYYRAADIAVRANSIVSKIKLEGQRGSFEKNV